MAFVIRGSRENRKHWPWLLIPPPDGNDLQKGEPEKKCLTVERQKLSGLLCLDGEQLLLSAEFISYFQNLLVCYLIYFFFIFQYSTEFFYNAFHK